MLSMPSTCWLCRMPLTFSAHGLCSVCLRQLPKTLPCCPRCGLPALHSRSPCGRCQLHPPAWQRMIYVTDWQFPLREWVKQLKFHHGTALSPLLARLMLLSWLSARRQFALDRPDLLLCVPLHRQRAWRRGYNQMDDITRRLSRWIGCPYAATGITRQRKTRIQHRLRACKRKINVRGAFSLEIDVQGRHIALLDDVITTGSTMQEISRILLAAGAASVQVWSLCRAL
ncbi:DNA utilization protein GntX [Erwinia psidii]|uniref:DNA utilization protein GntX n=1 Tax=Erwinia psidii TaxID=69224 RepID=UPI00226B4FD0|nr:DNA utilization protein GntX [Erwinia psidii]MCX8958854.1 DNA utilization protein GntX [Erwinia psidii]